MDTINKLVGSISIEDFMRGLLQATKTNHLGETWEKCVTCDKCLFEKQCQTICSTLEEQDTSKNPTCRDVINLLLGEIKVEDVK
jgi:hypothetical protein